MIRSGRTASILVVVALGLLANAAPAAPSYQDTVLADSPYGYWRLGESSGTTAVNLGSGGAALNGNYGQFSPPDGVPILAVPGIPGGGSDTAVRFTGTSPVSQVYIPDLVQPTAYTLEAWVNPSAAALTGSGILVRTAADPRSTWSHQIRIDPNGQFESYTYDQGPDGAARYIWDPVPATAGQWQHVVATASDGGPMKLYVDGKQVAEWAGPPGFLWRGGNQWRIGAVTGNGTFKGGTIDWFDGDIDEVAIYHHVLSGDTVTEHYRAGMLAAAPAPRVAENASRKMTAGDFDGDGANEVAYLRADKKVYLHDPGTGQTSLLLPAVQATAVTAADLDGDGRSELAFLDAANGELKSYDFATATTTTHTGPAGYPSFQMVSAGNVDGSPGEELMVSSNNGDQLFVLSGGSWINTLGQAVKIASGDLNAGSPGAEFIVRNSGGAPYVYNDAPGNWTGLGGAIDEISVGNLFPSDAVDEVYANDNARSLYVHNNGGWRGPASTGFAPAVGRVDDNLPAGQEQAFVIGAVNAGNFVYQSQPDWNETSLGAYTLLKTDASGFASFPDAADNWGWSDLLVADIDADGRDELVTRRQTATGESLHVFNNGDAGFVRVSATARPIGNVAQGKPVIAGSGAYSDEPFSRSDAGNFLAQRVTDGRVDETFGQTYWLGRQGVDNENLTIDLLGVYDIQQIVLRNIHNAQYNDRGTQDFKVYASMDNISFTEILSGRLDDVNGVNGETTSPVQRFTAEDGLTPTQARYLKFETLSRRGGSVGLNEFMASSDRNIALGAPVIDGSGAHNGAPFDQGFFSARRITDGGPTDRYDMNAGTQLGTYWLGSDGVANEYLTLDLGEVQDVNTIALRNTHNANYNDRATQDFRIWASDQVDASNQLVNPQLILDGRLSLSLGGNYDPMLPTDTFNVDNGLRPGQYRYLKFETLSSWHANNHVGLNEIEVFEERLPANVAAGKPIIKSSGEYSGYPASNVTDLRLDDYDAAGARSFWLGREKTAGEYFVLDLEKPFLIERIELQNTHNRGYDDRGTADFEIWASLEVDASNDLVDPFLVLEGTLPDRFGTGYDIPFDVFSAANGDFVVFSAQYLQFTANTYYSAGGYGGSGLNEIRVFAAIPEPLTLGLLGTALLGLGGYIRKRRRA